MATVTFDIYSKYWPKAATDDMVEAIKSKLAERGIVATISQTQNEKPQRITVTLTGVPANLVVRHADIAEKINARLGLSLSK